MANLDDFKSFVKKYDKIKDDVINNKRTWQSLYEQWSILGEEDKIWEPYKNSEVKEERANLNIPYLNQDSLKTVISYAKKIKPETVTNTINSIQNILALIGGFTGGKEVANTKTGDPLFDKNLDDWY